MTLSICQLTSICGKGCTWKRILSIFCLCLCFLRAEAQDLPLTDGEQVDYDLYFKWGVLMPKAGLARLSVQDSLYAGESAWYYGLVFRTSGMLEKIFKMRDTIECYYSKSPRLLFSSKRTNEGDHYRIDELTFNYKEKDRTEIHSLRRSLTEIKIDTLLIAEGLVFDMLAATMYLRSLDWSDMHMDDDFPFITAIGRDLVKVRFRYTGQRIVEHKNAKYSTRHFYIDIYDEAFTQTKEAAEVWIGDDENHIPVKIRAKLKIGAAEVYYKDSQGLRTPLRCRFIISNGEN